MRARLLIAGMSVLVLLVAACDPAAEEETEEPLTDDGAEEEEADGADERLIAALDATEEAGTASFTSSERQVDLEPGDAGTDSDVGSDTGEESDAETDSDAESDSDVGTDTGTGTGTDSDADTGTDTDTGAESASSGMGAESEAEGEVDFNADRREIAMADQQGGQVIIDGHDLYLPLQDGGAAAGDAGDQGDDEDEGEDEGLLDDGDDAQDAQWARIDLSGMDPDEDSDAAMVAAQVLLDDPVTALDILRGGAVNVTEAGGTDNDMSAAEEGDLVATVDLREVEDPRADALGMLTQEVEFEVNVMLDAEDRIEELNWEVVDAETEAGSEDGVGEDDDLGSDDGEADDDVSTDGGVVTDEGTGDGVEPVSTIRTVEFDEFGIDVDVQVPEDDQVADFEDVGIEGLAVPSSAGAEINTES